MKKLRVRGWNTAKSTTFIQEHIVSDIDALQEVDIFDPAFPADPVTNVVIISVEDDILGSDKGGTGQSTYTAGQLLIGNNSGALAKNTLTAGPGISVVNGDGSITISSTATGFSVGDKLVRQISLSDVTAAASDKGISANSSTYVRCGEFSFNKAAYTVVGSVLSFEIDFIYEASSTAVGGNFRLYNLTNATTITGSTTAVPPGAADTPRLLTFSLPEINIPTGTLILEPQINKTAGANKAVLKFNTMIFKIINTF